MWGRVVQEKGAKGTTTVLQTLERDGGERGGMRREKGRGDVNEDECTN